MPKISPISPATYARSREEALTRHTAQLDLGEQAMHHGYHTVGVGLQKAAKILDQSPSSRPNRRTSSLSAVRSAAGPISNIDRARTIVQEAEQVLANPPPFHPAGPHPNPWAARATSRSALLTQHSSTPTSSVLCTPRNQGLFPCGAGPGRGSRLVPDF